MVDVETNHDKLLLMLADLTESNKTGTIMQTVRKTTRKTSRSRNTGESNEVQDFDGGSANVQMTVTRTTRKRNVASLESMDGERNQEDEEPPTTLRRSKRTRSRTNSYNDMVTPMPTKCGVGRTPFSSANTKVAVTPGIVPGSASRMPKKGEVFFSKNGNDHDFAFCYIRSSCTICVQLIEFCLNH